MKHEPDFEGCNHHLSSAAAEAAPKILAKYGNAPFVAYGEPLLNGVQDELVEGGFLRHGPTHDNRATFFHVGKLVIGKPPRQPVKRKAV